MGEQITTTTPQKRKRKWYDIVITIILSILFVITMSFVVFSIIFVKIEVVGVSMQPTYNINLETGKSREYYEKSQYRDKVYVNRFDKGKRGDIIVVTTQTKVDDKIVKEKVIKRLVAVGGDSVDFQQDGEYYYFYLNGEKQLENYIKDQSAMLTCYEKFVAYKQSLGVRQDQPIKLADNQVFILGDNRGANSKDSSTYGPVDKKDIVGKVTFSVPYNKNFISYIIFGQK